MSSISSGFSFYAVGTLMSNLEANLDTMSDATVDLNALADKRIMKHITFVVLGMMGVAVAIVVTASSIA